ncbi:hypothetical protein SDC9_52880 [bioreactor metagenome]|uniref:Tetratricopeptide repeat protein n=1 Tax=bioreactor metagenome TaxID=1076179 RepID=A0A644WSA7_9ZZZZ
MKVFSFLLVILIVFTGFSVSAQNVFSAYDGSSVNARAAWDECFRNGKTPDPTAFDSNNPYERSLLFLAGAIVQPTADSVLRYTAVSVLTLRDRLDTLPFIMPVEVENRLSATMYNSRDQLLDGLMQLYYQAPWQCAYFLKEKQQLSRAANDNRNLATAYLNEALIYTELVGRPELALPIIDSACAIWKEIGDVFHTANGLKAKGLAYMRMKKFREAEKEIKAASALFVQNDLQAGVESCRLDLVLLFALDGQPDSVKKYDELCRPEFEKSDTMRLFVLNIDRIAAYKSANQYSIRDFAKQNHDLLVNSHFHPAMVIDFYYYSIKAFEFFGEAALLKTYRSEYENIKKLLIKEGYWPGLFKI